MEMETRYFSLFITTARQTKTSDFIISFNLFGQYDNFEDWDAAEEKERREYEQKKDNSIQFSFIYIAPNYNNCHLKALK